MLRRAEYLLISSIEATGAVRLRDLTYVTRGVRNPPSMSKSSDLFELAELRAMVRAAGGVIYRRHDEGYLETLLVHRPRYDDWSFAKGKLDPGESYEDCALREVQEETGLICELKGEIAGSTYIDRHQRPKIVRYWAMKPVSGKFRPCDEVDQIAWLSLPDARSALSYEHDVEVLESMAQLKSAGRALILRHGAAGDRLKWEGVDRDRPLTAKGRRQAAALVETLRHQDVVRIFSSPYVRCSETVEPLATALGLEIEIRDELAEGADGAAELMTKAVRGTAGAVVLCTHGDIIWDLIGSGEARKASTWVLAYSKKGFRVAAHLPPPEV